MSALNGWTVVSDTAWDGYEDIPLTVMKGYTVMIGEALDATAAPPTHLFLVQAGVGGMAAAVAAYAAQRLGAAAPKVVVVEPARAACVAASVEAGRPATIPHGEPTIMAMLECATPSPLGWADPASPRRRLRDAGRGREAVAAMRRLAFPAEGDPAIVAGESGATGLAGFLSCLHDPAAKGNARPRGRIARARVQQRGRHRPRADLDAGIVGKAPEEIDR